MKTRRRALVLQGGGALGAYAYGVIKALYEQPDFSLDAPLLPHRLGSPSPSVAISPGRSTI